MLQVLTFKLPHRLIILLISVNHIPLVVVFETRFRPVGLRLACDIRIFIVRLAVFCILITDRWDHAKSEDICVDKRFVIKKAQGKSVQVQYF